MSTLANADELLAVYRDGLLKDTLPFWISGCVDREDGGFMMSLDRDGSLLDTDKGVWQQGRFTWLLGELYNNVEPKEEWLDLARHGVSFLDEHCFDPVDGRMFFHLAKDGQPIRKRRYAFGESFAAIAYGEFAKATGSNEYAEKAAVAFERFLNHSPAPKFTSQRPTRGIGHPMITINTAQELRESIGLDSADALIDQAIETIVKYHVKEDIECVVETVGEYGQLLDHFDGRTLNPGHAIEGAWFIIAEGKHRNDDSLVKLGCRMLDWMWKRGWDEVHGGLLYFVGIDGRPVQEYWHDMKFWWPHNEAIIATLLAFQVTGDQKYADWHRQIHDWSYQHFADEEHGEWYGYLRRDGAVSSPVKGNIWKGPFHFPRMQLICWQLLSELSD